MNLTDMRRKNAERRLETACLNHHEQPPAPCPSLGRCTYPNCGHFLDVTSATSSVTDGVQNTDGGQ